jgi:hypothetical protein|tara:strand:+ start:1168 stop:1404 length:237 start_codon:yes stop_codon:yes gene_type:complete
MTKETYISQLQSGTKKITFTKVDGSERVMNATLDPAVLNKVYGEQVSATQRNASTLTVFDTDKKDWRAMRLDSIKSFE